MPPPNSNKIPHGNFTASAQLSSFLLPSLLGKMNKIIAAKIAIIVSSIAGINCFIKNDCVTQANAVKIKTIKTDFSSYETLPNSFNCLSISFKPLSKF